MVDRRIEILSSAADDQELSPVDQTVIVNAIASAEAFGSPVVAGPVIVNGIPSAEAFGSPTVVSAIAVVGIPSDEAFGTPLITLYVTPVGIASAEAFGAPTVLVPQFVNPNSIPSAEAFGAPQVNLTIFSTGIASDEAFGTPLLTLYVTPVGIVSAEAFGVPGVSVDQTIYPNGVPSDEAFGAPQVNLTIFPTSIASDEAFGSPTVKFVGPFVFPDGIPSGEAFGLPTVFNVLQFVYPTSIPSMEAFGDVLVTNFGALQVTVGGRGDIRGGAPIRLTGAVLDMRTCSDAFDDGVVSPTLWTDISAGGLVLESNGGLELDTRLTANSVAGVRSVDIDTHLDVEAQFFARQVTLPVDNVVRVGSLGLYASVGNEFRLDLETDRTGVLIVRVFATIGGATVVDQTKVVGRIVDVTVLRILRCAGRVLAYVNNVPVSDAAWTQNGSAFQFLAANGTTAGTRVRTQVSAFVRRPAVVIGIEPVRTYSFLSPGVVVADAPTYERPDIVDVTVHGCAFVDSVVDGFTYIVENRLVAGRSSRSQLVVLNDPALKEK